MLTKRDILPCANLVCAALYVIYTGKGILAMLPIFVFLTILALPWVLLAAQKRVTPRDAWARWGICVSPLLATYVIALCATMRPLSFFAISNTLAMVCFVLTYFAMREIGRAAKLITLGVLFTVFAVLQDAMPGQCYNVSGHLAEKSIAAAAYDASRDNFRAKPAAYYETSGEAEVTGKAYNVLKILLEDYLTAYMNNRLHATKVYDTHPMLQQFRNSDEYAKKWDSFHANAEITISKILARDGIGRTELTAVGKRKIIPGDNSSLNYTIIQDCSYTLDIRRQDKNKWMVYYVRNNKTK